MDTEDLRHQIKQMGDLLALCLTEQRAVLAKFEQVSADLSAVASAVAPRPKLSTRDWNTELAVLGHWHWSPPTRLHGWWAMTPRPCVRYTDSSLVPRHLCEPSHALVKAALEAGEDVPGAELYYEDSVTKRG